MANETTYDVFLSYNSRDREVVQKVAAGLKQRGCKCFVDQWYLAPGKDWVAALERALQGSGSAAVFIGPHEMGRWQQRERAWALDRLAEHDDFPVVPVLFLDFIALARNMGGPSSGLAVVPEPNALALLFCCSLVAIAVRRKRHGRCEAF